MTDIFKYLAARPYPGRGILLGAAPSGRRAAAYFIMGRSENSRNRVFTGTEDGIKTEAHDPSKMTDPSLIIYRPVRAYKGSLIVTNGDQTDTIYEYMAMGKSPKSALKTRTFEPDAPSFTPRVSGVLSPDGTYLLSILKSLEGDGDCCCRYFFEYGAVLPGRGHFISTYEGVNGEPVPSFSGEPVFAAIEDESALGLAEKLWDALDRDNRVSLYVNIGGESVIINKNTEKTNNQQN